MDYEKAFNALPDAAALSAANRRCVLAEQKRADEGAWALTEDEIDAICLMRAGECTRREIDAEIKAHQNRKPAPPKTAPGYVTRTELQSVVKEIFSTLSEILGDAMDKRNAKSLWRNGRLAELEQRMAKLDGRTAQAVNRHFTPEEARALVEADAPSTPRRLKGRHRGTWDRTATYAKGDAVIHENQLWVARASGFACAEPGKVTRDYWIEARAREDQP